jgi:hypothetical protein
LRRANAGFEKELAVSSGTTVLDKVLSELEYEFGGQEGEGEVSTQTSWFWVDAWQLSPFFAKLDQQEFQNTPAYAQQIVTGMCISLSNQYPGSRIGIRCLRWTGSSWTACGSIVYSPCVSYP